LIHGRTVAITAHRLKTARRTNNIIVLNGGQVVKQGSHDELLAKDGLYARFWMLQQEALGWSLIDSASYLS
jgi:ATP-binding cassette subfamily B protein